MELYEFRDWLHQKVREIGTQRQAAQEWGISTSYLSSVLRGVAQPGDKLLKALRMEREIHYKGARG